MKLRIQSVAVIMCFICLRSTNLFAENDASNVKISEIKEQEAAQQADEAPTKWTENERSEKVSKYGTVAPIQLPVEYAGKTVDLIVSGVSKVSSAIISLPLKVLPKSQKTDQGGQNGKAETKKEG